MFFFSAQHHTHLQNLLILLLFNDYDCMCLNKNKEFPQHKGKNQCACNYLNFEAKYSICIYQPKMIKEILRIL
jgi:hypothetical protein